MTQHGSLVRVVLGVSTTPMLVWEKGGECPALPTLFPPSPLSLFRLHLTPSLPHPISTTIPFADELIERCYQNFSLFLRSNLIFWYHWQFLSPANCFSLSFITSFLFFLPHLSHSSFFSRASTKTSESPRWKIFKIFSGRNMVSEKEDWSLIFLNQGMYIYKSLLFKTKKCIISFLYWKRAGIAKVSTIWVILGGPFVCQAQSEMMKDIYTLPALQSKYPTEQ